jgi:hypothetical protein
LQRTIGFEKGKVTDFVVTAPAKGGQIRLNNDTNVRGYEKNWARYFKLGRGSDVTLLY